MREYYICHICGNRMYRRVKDKEYRLGGTCAVVHDVEFFICENCGESILESQEVKRIEEIVLSEVANKKS